MTFYKVMAKELLVTLLEVTQSTGILEIVSKNMDMLNKKCLDISWPKTESIEKKEYDVLYGLISPIPNFN